MVGYSKVFGDQTLPPSDYGFAAYSLTADSWFSWPYNSGGSEYPVAKIMEVSCAIGNSIYLPDATQVSPGEDFLIRNAGGYTLTIKDNGSTPIGYLTPGQAMYFYLKSNTSAAGTYSSVLFGVGTSSIDAATLTGYGIKAIGATLNQKHSVTTFSTNSNVIAANLASLLVSTGGLTTLSLPAVGSSGDGFFFILRNSGSGTLTVSPDGTDTIDGLSSTELQPGESVFVFDSGISWHTVGYGRSVFYQFTQLVKDVSAGGTITLTSDEAGHKLLTFVGNPASAVTVIAPAVVSVYYTKSEISTSQTITLKTLAGTGVGIGQTQSIIAICDGTDIMSAQTAIANTQLTLIDGTAASPALSFSSTTNSGLYKHGSYGMAWSSNGVELLHFDTLGSYLMSGILIDGTLWCHDFYANGNVSITGNVTALGITTLANGSTAVTQAPGDNSTKVCTTAYADALAFSSSLPNQAGHAGQIITTDGTNASWSAIGTANQIIKVKSDGSGLEGSVIGAAGQRIRVNSSGTALEGTANELTLSSTIKSANYNAASGDTYPQDTSGGAFTVTLPASANAWDPPIRIHDIAGKFGTNNLTINGNGNKIEGDLADFIVDIDYFSAVLTWSVATYGWVFI